MFSTNRQECLAEKSVVLQRVGQLCLPPHFIREFHYQETSTIRPERPEYRELQNQPSNKPWNNVVYRISRGMLNQMDALHLPPTSTRAKAVSSETPSYDPPLYSLFQDHETGELLDAALSRLSNHRSDRRIRGATRATLRGVSAILYQQELIGDITKAQLPRYTRHPRPQSKTSPCSTSKLDTICRRMNSSPLLTTQRKIFPKLLRLVIWQMLLDDYGLDAAVPTSSGHGITPETGLVFRDLVCDVVDFARAFPSAVVEARHLSSGFGAFMLQLDRLCERNWTSLAFEDVMHMLFALRTSQHGGGYRGLVADLRQAVEGRGDGDDEDGGGVVGGDPGRVERARLALQRKLSVDACVLVRFAVQNKLHKRILVGVIDRIAGEMGLIVRASDLKPKPRKLVKTAFDTRYEDGALRETATLVRRKVLKPVKRWAKAMGRAACNALLEAGKVSMVEYPCFYDCERH